MRRLLALVATLTLLGGCVTGNFVWPDRNPSPQNKFVIFGTKDPATEVHFRFVFATAERECEEKRPMGAGNFPVLLEDTITVEAGTAAFTAEYFLDRYLPGHCQWHPIRVKMAINFPPQEFPAGLYASWSEIASIGVDTAKPDDMVYRCRRRAPGARTLWCKGGDAHGNSTRVADRGGQLHVTIALEGGH